MKCQSVREALAVIRPDSGDAVQPEFASEMVHLEQCADCRTFFETQQRADMELSRAMRRVTIPADLQSRLLNRLTAGSADRPVADTPLTGTLGTNPVAAENSVTPAGLAADTHQPVAASAPPVVTPEAPASHPRTRRNWTRRQLLALAGALLVAVFGSWWFVHANRKLTQTLNQLVALSHTPLAPNAPVFEESFRLNLPDSEIRITTPPSGVKSLRINEREVGARLLYPMRLAANRSAVSVMLVIIDLKRVQVPNLSSVPTSFQSASVDYPPPNSYATRVWHVGQTLYVCYVLSHDPQALGRLRNQASTT